MISLYRSLKRQVLWGLGLTLSLSIKKAQKPYIIGSLGPKALIYESFEGNGISLSDSKFRRDSVAPEYAAVGMAVAAGVVLGFENFTTRFRV